MTRQSATEAAAHRAMQAALNAGWTAETLLVDAGAEALVKDGMPQDTAYAVAQAVFNRKYRIMMGVG